MFLMSSGSFVAHRCLLSTDPYWWRNHLVCKYILLSIHCTSCVRLFYFQDIILAWWNYLKEKGYNNFQSETHSAFKCFQFLLLVPNLIIFRLKKLTWTACCIARSQEPVKLQTYWMLGYLIILVCKRIVWFRDHEVVSRNIINFGYTPLNLSIFG